jgi:hypothetical protein
MRRRAFVNAMLAMAWPASTRAARLTAASPMRQCARYDAATLAALARGDKRLAVVVGAYDVPSPASSSIVVSVVGEGGSREEVARFAVHPERSFGAAAEPQRFLVSLEGHRALLRKDAPVCIEVGFAASAGAVRGGAADVRVELVDLPGARR